jgi:STE24 endopeptidase
MANEDRATRYHRLQRRAAVAATAAGAVLLGGLALGGGAIRLRDAVEGVAGGAFLASTAIYAATLVLLAECVQLPFAFYQGVSLERRYGLSTQTTGHWWADRVKTAVLVLAVGTAAALTVRLLIAWWPDTWWACAALVFTGALVLIAYAAPVLLLPLFYELGPVRRPGLVDRLVALAVRADTRVMGVFEWRLGTRTRKANAALTGIGRTRRILLSDTLLAGQSDEEIEVILAHELAHHVHHDLWTGLALDAVLMTAGFYAADRVLAAAGVTLGLSGQGDLAALPVLALTAGGVGVALLPVVRAWSRHQERRADRYALEMTDNAAAFISAMKRLSLQNLAEERPSRTVEVLFHSHPPTSARLAAASAWAGRRRAPALADEG